MTQEYACQFPFRTDDSKNFKSKYHSTLITSVQQFREITDGISNSLLAGDTETNGLNYAIHSIVGFSFSTNPYNGYYVPIRHQDESQNLPEDEIFPLILEFIYRNKWLFYNWLFDGLMLKKEGLDVDRVKVQDVWAYVFNADTNIKRNNLKWAAKFFLNRESPTFEETTGGNNITFDMLDVNQCYDYACQDTSNTFALWSFLSKYLIPACKDVLLYDSKLVRYTVKYYAECDLFLDTEYMKELSISLRKRRDSLHKEIMRLMGRTPQNPINLNSEPQLIQAFVDLGISTGKTTETGQMSVDKKSIAAMGGILSEKLVEYSFLNKQITSYVDKLSKKRQGKINYKLFATSTARIASGHSEKDGDYYLPLSYQTLTKPKSALFEKTFVGDNPKDESLVLGYRFRQLRDGEENDIDPVNVVEGYDQLLNIRKAITVQNHDKKEWYFLRLDYASEELRIIGGMSKDPLYMKSFTDNVDLYKTVASGMFEVPYEHVTSALRKKAKFCVLGLNYGGSYVTIMNNAGLQKEDAIETEQKYRAAVAPLEQWKRDLVQKCYSDYFIERTYQDELNGYTPEQIERSSSAPKVPFLVRSAYGRPRWVGFWLGSPEKKQKTFGVRTVVSQKIQGTAGDIIRRVMCVLYENVFSRYPDKVKFVGCVHDEIDCCIRKDSLWLIDIIKENMEINPPGCSLNLPVEYDLGYSYGELYPFKKNSDGIYIC